MKIKESLADIIEKDGLPSGPKTEVINHGKPEDA